MKICHFDAFSGISGDMTVGALVDAGADWPALEAALLSLNLNASFRIAKTSRKGISASRFFIEASDQTKHRHLPQIEKIIASGRLSDTAKRNALAVFRRLGEAEGRTHGVPVEKIHFHEVGAVDSICDIVGACAALDLLGVTEVSSSRINVGSGTVNTQHGVLPIPAPATARLLENHPIYSAGPEAELTTPTGAALLTTLATSFGGVPPLRVFAQGFGAGEKEFPMQANVLRAIIGERITVPESISVNVLEANIDDSTPQVLGYAMERLFDAGALDVTLTPILMKKNRSATLLSVIAPPELTDVLTAVLFAETSTLGIRVTQAERRVLARKVATVETSYGPLRVKYTDTGAFAAEYDDCRRAAAERGVPLRRVIAEASEAFRTQFHS